MPDQAPLSPPKKKTQKAPMKYWDTSEVSILSEEKKIITWEQKRMIHLLQKYAKQI